MAATKNTRVINDNNSTKSNKSTQYDKIMKGHISSQTRKLVGGKPRAQMASRTARRTSNEERVRRALQGLYSTMQSFKESTKATYKNECDLSEVLDGLSLAPSKYRKTVRFDLLNNTANSALTKSSVYSDGCYDTSCPPDMPRAQESRPGCAPVTAMPCVVDNLTNSVNSLSLMGAGKSIPGQKITRDMFEMGLVSKEEIKEQARRAWDNIDETDIDGIRELANVQSQEIGDECMDWSVIPDFA